MNLTTQKLKQLIREELAKMSEEEMVNEITLSERLTKDSFGNGKPLTGIVGIDYRVKGLDKGDYVQIIPVKDEDGEYRGTYKKFNKIDILKHSKKTGGMPGLPAVKQDKSGFSFMPAGEFFYTGNSQMRELEKVRSIDMKGYTLLTLEDMMKIGVPMDSDLEKLAKQNELPMSENRKRRIRRK